MVTVKKDVFEAVLDALEEPLSLKELCLRLEERYGEDELLEALRLLTQSGKIRLIIVTYPCGVDFMYEPNILGDQPAQDGG